MFLGVALVRPASLNLFEQTCVRNCVLVCNAGNDRVIVGVPPGFVSARALPKSFFACGEPLVRPFLQSQRHV